MVRLSTFTCAAHLVKVSHGTKHLTLNAYEIAKERR